jgi:hypothetical protein
VDAGFRWPTLDCPSVICGKKGRSTPASNQAIATLDLEKASAGLGFALGWLGDGLTHGPRGSRAFGFGNPH